MTDTTKNDEPNTSTREQIAEAIYRCGGDWNLHRLPWDRSTNTTVREAHLKRADAALALFSQPSPSTPSAEPCGRRGWMDETQDWDKACVCKQESGHGSLHVCDDCGEAFAGGLPSEPPRIEDMAPGTRFVGAVRHGTRTFMRTIDAVIAAESGLNYFPDDIEPSSVRDVTPPPALPNQEDA